MRDEDRNAQESRVWSRRLVADLFARDRGQRPGRRRAGAGRQVSGGRHCEVVVVVVVVGCCRSARPRRWDESADGRLGADGSRWCAAKTVVLVVLKAQAWIKRDCGGVDGDETSIRSAGGCRRIYG